MDSCSSTSPDTNTHTHIAAWWMDVGRFTLGKGAVDVMVTEPEILTTILKLGAGSKVLQLLTSY